MRQVERDGARRWRRVRSLATLALLSLLLSACDASGGDRNVLGVSARDVDGGAADSSVTVAADADAGLTSHVDAEVSVDMDADVGADVGANVTPTVELPEAVGFAGLGHLWGGDSGSYATAVSASGRVVVGWSVGPQGDEAVRWTAARGLEGLGGEASQALGVSPDGALIVGRSLTQGVIWDGHAPFRMRSIQAVEAIPVFVPDGGTSSETTGFLSVLMTDAYAVRNDGVIYGVCKNLRQPSGIHQYPSFGCRFSSPSVGARIGNPDYISVTQVFAADDCGNYAGVAEPPTFVGTAPQAVFDDGAYRIDGDPQRNQVAPCGAEARAFSADPVVVVGTVRAHPPVSAKDAGIDAVLDTAFVLPPGEPFLLRLPDLDGGETISGAYAITANGRVVGGFGTDAVGEQAVLWIDNNPVALKDVLRSMGVTPPDGWVLLEVRGVSADGRIFVGNGRNPQGQPEAFRVVLPEPLGPGSNPSDAGPSRGHACLGGGAADAGTRSDAGELAACFSPLRHPEDQVYPYGYGCSCVEDGLPPGPTGHRGYCLGFYGLICNNTRWRTTLGSPAPDGPCAAPDPTAVDPTSAECDAAGGAVSSSNCPSGFYSTRPSSQQRCCYPLVRADAECTAVGYHIEARDLAQPLLQARCAAGRVLGGFVADSALASLCCGD